MNVLIHSCLHCCLPLFYIIVICFWGRVPKIPIISETASHLFIICGTLSHILQFFYILINPQDTQFSSTWFQAIPHDVGSNRHGVRAVPRRQRRASYPGRQLSIHFHKHQRPNPGKGGRYGCLHQKPRRWLHRPSRGILANQILHKIIWIIRHRYRLVGIITYRQSTWYQNVLWRYGI